MIDFQPKNFFNDLTDFLKKFKDNNFKRREFFQAENFKSFTENLHDLIFKYTGLPFRFYFGEPKAIEDFFGPATSPVLRDSTTLTVLVQEDEYLKEVTDFVKEATAKVKVGKVKLYPKTGMIKGLEKIDEEARPILFLPFSFFRDNTFTAEELAAIILHEIGHNYTLIDLTNTCVLFNNALKDVVDCWTAKKNIKEKTIVINKITEKLDFKVDADTLSKEEKVEVAAAILINSFNGKVKSDIGFAYSDRTLSESLADQYCVRMGGGRYIVTGLSKFPHYTQTASIFYTCLINSCLSIAVSLVVPNPITIFLSIFFFMAALGSATAPYASNYGTLSERFRKIKRQLIEQLKTTNLPNRQVKELLDDIEQIDKILTDVESYPEFSDGKIFLMSIFDKITYKHLKENDIVKLYEELAHNTAYIAAAKLKTV